MSPSSQPTLGLTPPGPLADLLLRRKLASVTAQRTFALAGGPMSYGFSRAEVARRSASFVDRILKGATPASLAVEERTTYELLFNMKTGKDLGISISQAQRLRANEVIE